MFLKSTGLVKRRSLAKQFIGEGKVFLNNRQVFSAGKNVKKGDIITISSPSREIKVIIKKLPSHKSIPKKEREIYIEILEEKRKNISDNLIEIQYNIKESCNKNCKNDDTQWEIISEIEVKDA